MTHVERTIFRHYLRLLVIRLRLTPRDVDTLGDIDSDLDALENVLFVEKERRYAKAD